MRGVLARLPRALARGALAGLAGGLAALGAGLGVWWVSRLLAGDRPGETMMRLDSVRAVTVANLLLVFAAGAVGGAAVGFLVAGLWRREG